METKLISRKLGARIYLELMPRVANYSEAQELSKKVTELLEKNKSVEQLGELLYKELGKEVLENTNNANLLAKLLFKDYTGYLAQ